MEQEQRNFSGSSSSRTETANKVPNSDQSTKTSPISENVKSNNVRASSSDSFQWFNPRQQPIYHSATKDNGPSSSGGFNRFIPPTRPRQHGDSADDIIKSIVSFDIIDRMCINIEIIL